MSALKRKRDTFYIETPSKRPGTGTQRNPLSTFANGLTTHLPPTPSSVSKVKKEHFPSANREPEYTKRIDEEEAESQLPASEREEIRQNLQLEYDQLKLVYKDKVFETKTLEGQLLTAQAQLASTQEQLQLLRENHQALVKDFHNKNQKSLQTERRLRGERDQFREDLVLVRSDRDAAAVERDAAIVERDVAQRASRKAEEELREYQEFFALHSRLVARAQAPSHAQ
ncbi:hypothetical protein F5878DRAFT_681636 [Lentinula raphanica]|uniref:Uncharacterized protein n=1 Tax=Lentinula raphanica TaxID=153919 RepID=A0AA38P9S7_9AGAR|nr:hypothetical protein F5878DRAFT_681636 [Lentinula raphanica]